MQVKVPIIFILFFTMLGCTSRGAYTGVEWQKHASVESQGFDPKKLERLSQYLTRVDETAGFMVIHDGKVLYEYGDLSEIGYVASVRKSMLSMLYGKYVDDGTIDLNQTIEELGIDDVQGLLPIERQAKVKHLITARSGVYHPAANGGYDKSFAELRGTKNPGDNFVYNNWDYNVAGYVFEKKVGQSIYEELEQQLAIPLGFQDWNIKNQRKLYKNSVSRYPAYHVYVSTRDMAKIGQLMLNKGKWDNKQLISESWVAESTKPVTTQQEMLERYGDQGERAPNYSYSSMWWNFDEFRGDKRYKGSYLADGWGGEYILVIPEMKLVIVHKANVSKLVKIGLFKGGISKSTFHTMAHMVMEAKNDS